MKNYNILIYYDIIVLSTVWILNAIMPTFGLSVIQIMPVNDIWYSDCMSRIWVMRTHLYQIMYAI